MTPTRGRDGVDKHHICHKGHVFVGRKDFRRKLDIFCGDVIRGTPNNFTPGVGKVTAIDSESIFYVIVGDGAIFKMIETYYVLKSTLGREPCHDLGHVGFDV